MKVLHVVPTYLPATRYGGPIYSVHGLCKGLVACGVEADVFTTSVDGPEDSPVEHETPIDVDGVKVTYFRSSRMRRLYYSPPLKKALRSAVLKYDVVHLHSVFLWPTLAAARIASRAGRPYVVSPRGMLVPELIQAKSAIIKRTWIALFEKRTIAAAAQVHFTSQIEATDFSRMRLTCTSSAIVPNGVDARQAQSDGAKRSPPFALYLGRISWKKGLERLLEAWRAVPFHLEIVGNDDEDFARKLQAEIDRQNLRDRITIRPAVHGDEKWALLREASVLVLPSYSENFGNVVLEAMVSGTAVVVTPEVGAAPIVDAHHAGVVVEGDPAAFSDGVNSILRSDDRIRSLGINGRTAAESYYSWEQIAQKTRSLYEKLL